MLKDDNSFVGHSQHRPILSVVVPVYNSKNDLKLCLAALVASEYDDFEVLVVDDGSTDSIRQLVEECGFSYVRIEGPGGPARARNHGVSLVQGRYIVFIDADVCVHPDTLVRFATAFYSDPTIDAVIGSYDETPAKTNFISQYKNLFHHYVHQQSEGCISTFWTGCGAIRRELFLSVGGFDAQRYRRPAIEDIELGTWLTAAGYKIVLNKNIKAKHLKRWTLWNLLKTDVFDRGVPWTRLMLRAGALANTLNVTSAQRLSVGLAYLAPLVMLAALWWRPLWWGSLVAVLTLSLLNLDFYRFFVKRTGFWFTLRVVPLHWLYFWYCGLSFGFGTLLHYRDRALSHIPSTPNWPLGPKAHAE
jgi:cellulose synthase/poly-beta-1,6-N-acetylglucosamine synthase-like glycosyltransferase